MLDLRVLAYLCLIGFVSAPVSVAADTVEKRRTVSVSATGYVVATPDIAKVVVGVVTEAATAKAALEKNSKLFQAVIAGIKSLEINPKDIATQQFQVSPVYSRQKRANGYRAPKIDGYRVHNSASVTIRNIKWTGSVIDRATELGANNIGSIQFTVSGLETKLDGARQSAMRNAIRRAKLYAEAAGAKLGDIRTISEQFHGGGQPRPMHRGRASAMAASAPIEPGQQKLGVTVHAVWELE